MIFNTHKYKKVSYESLWSVESLNATSKKGLTPIGSVTGHSKINSGGSPETSMALAFRRNNFSFSHSLMRAQSLQLNSTSQKNVTNGKYPD